jgi:uncharacterized protein DUF932
MSIKLSLKKRVLKNTGTPLTIAEAATVAPALLHDAAGVTTLERYSHIPTYAIIEEMQQMGMGIAEVAQSRAAYDWADREQKHMVRMRPLQFFDAPAKVGEVVPEICVVNAHNASSKLHLYAGMYRFICANGLMVGDTVGHVSISHVGALLAEIQRQVKHVGEVLLPKAMQSYGRMQAHRLDEGQATVFAARAIALRWPEGTEAVSTADLLQSRRPQDAANDVWSIYNRVQENLLYGGFRARNRNVVVQPLSTPAHIVDVNRRLWDLAEKAAA